VTGGRAAIGLASGAFSALTAGLAKSAQQRAVEVSERRGLDSIGKQAQQQPAWQMGGRTSYQRCRRCEGGHVPRLKTRRPLLPANLIKTAARKSFYQGKHNSLGGALEIACFFRRAFFVSLSFAFSRTCCFRFSFLFNDLCASFCARLSERILHEQVRVESEVAHRLILLNAEGSYGGGSKCGFVYDLVFFAVHPHHPWRFLRSLDNLRQSHKPIIDIQQEFCFQAAVEMSNHRHYCVARTFSFRHGIVGFDE
jgi:hypothetical protein